MLQKLPGASLLGGNKKQEGLVKSSPNIDQFLQDHKKCRKVLKNVTLPTKCPLHLRSGKDGRCFSVGGVSFTDRMSNVSYTWCFMKNVWQTVVSSWWSNMLQCQVALPRCNLTLRVEWIWCSRFDSSYYTLAPHK